MQSVNYFSQYLPWLTCVVHALHNPLVPEEAKDHAAQPSRLPYLHLKWQEWGNGD